MHFSSEISIGNIITALSLMVGGIIAWVKMKGTVDESERRIQDLEISQGELDKRQTTLESVLSGIKADVGWIRETLQRIQNRADRESNQD